MNITPLKTQMMKVALNKENTEFMRKSAFGFGDGPIEVFLLKIEYKGKIIYGCWAEGNPSTDVIDLSPVGYASRLALTQLPSQGELYYCQIQSTSDLRTERLEQMINRIPDQSKVCFIANIAKLFWMLMAFFNIECVPNPNSPFGWDVVAYSAPTSKEKSYPEIAEDSPAQ